MQIGFAQAGGGPGTIGRDAALTGSLNGLTEREEKMRESLASLLIVLFLATPSVLARQEKAVPGSGKSTSSHSQLPRASGSLARAIFSKWNPVSSVPSPHAGLWGFEFLPDGRVRRITYLNSGYEGRPGGPEIAHEEDGYYQITGSKVNLRFPASKGVPFEQKENVRIVEVKRDRLAYCHLAKSEYQRGWADAGHWTPGTYRVELYVQERRVASGTFQIQ
jgi:hypothetical protein